MFEIVKNGTTIELQDSLTWVRDQKNGVIITCDEKDGIGMLSADKSKIYSVIGKPQLRDFEFVEINEIKWFPVAQKQQADLDYVAIMTGVEL